MADTKEEFAQFLEENYKSENFEIIHSREVNKSLKIFLISIPKENRLIFEIVSVLTSAIPSDVHLKVDNKLEYSPKQKFNNLLSQVMKDFDKAYKKRWKKQSL